METEQSADPEQLRSDIKDALTGWSLSMLLLGWAGWMVADFGMALHFVAAGIFAVLTALVFAYRALRPALNLRQNGHSVF